jgi:methyltransferase (TIGR00027 family)
MKRGSASTTAKVIAASTVLLASDSQTASLVAPGAALWCRRLLSMRMADRCLVASAGHPITRAVWRGLERLTLPGVMVHYWHRKRWIEQRCVAAIAGGATRVVVVGAGFDTLALRLATIHPHVAWIEVDHPDTQAAKREALPPKASGAATQPTFYAVDLSRDSLPSDLSGDPRSTVVVLEGLLMYLTEADVTALLRDQLPALSTQPVRVIFSYMVRWPTGRAGFRPASRLIDAWLAWRKEPFLWTLAPSALPAHVAQWGYTMQAHAVPPFTPTGASAAGGVLQGEQLVDMVALPRAAAVG